MKAPILFLLITLGVALPLASSHIASAQPSKATRPMAKSKSPDVSGIDTITPKEADDKTTKSGSGWNGSYVGVNAGTSFGATAGANVVVPLGSSDQQ